jgi:hypothetical protein
MKNKLRNSSSILRCLSTYVNEISFNPTSVYELLIKVSRTTIKYYLIPHIHKGSLKLLTVRWSSTSTKDWHQKVLAD